jgi:hypothetical protein
MKIRATRKLMDGLGRTAIEYQEAAPLSCWHADMLTVSQKHAVILVHDVTGFSVVLYPVGQREMALLDGLVPEAIRETLQSYMVIPDVIETFLESIGREILWTTTWSRSLVERLNRKGEGLLFTEDRLAGQDLVQWGAAHVLNSMVQPEGRSSLSAEELMMQKLRELSGKSPVSCRAAKLQVTLICGDYDAVRTLMVPLSMTFTELHHVLQASFDWQDYHLHDFRIYRDDAIEVNLVGDRESMEFPESYPKLLEHSIILEEYLPGCDRLVYTYDYGDFWEHLIEVVEIVDDYDSRRALCLSGQGDAPPEDVGGEPGFMEFLRILEDPKDPKHEEAKAWGTLQGYKEFSIEELNAKLKHVTI